MIAVETGVMMIGVTGVTDAATVVGVVLIVPLPLMSTLTVKFARSMDIQQVTVGGAILMTRRRRTMTVIVVTRVPTLPPMVLTQIGTLIQAPQITLLLN